MSFNILDEVKGYITPELISKAASVLGESENGIGKALSGVIPTVLSGFVTKSNSSNRDAGDILDIVRSAYKDSADNNPENFLSDINNPKNRGGSLVQALFGDKMNSLVSSVASFAGIKDSSSSSLFNMAGLLVARIIGKHHSEQDMSATKLSSFLHGQKTNIMSMLPAGLSSITNLLGLSKIGDTIQTNANDAAKRARTVENNKGGIGWLLWLLLFILVALAFWYFAGKGCNRNKTATITIDTVPGNAAGTSANAGRGVLDTTGNFIYNVGNATEIKLADGTILKVGESSTEATLFKMLSDPSWSIDTLDKTKNWVVLDRVYFETGKSMLTASSQAQVKNIATILHNFPRSSIKLGGYTDNTGDAIVNQKVSEERANSVAIELMKTGIDKRQVDEAIGYGPEYPVCPANDSPECKAQNRRVDLKVSSK